MVTIARRFDALLSNLALTSEQKTEGEARKAAVVKVLNQYYHRVADPTANSFFVGSWGKGTSVRSSKAMEVVFILPDTVQERFATIEGNRQLKLLEEIKSVLAAAHTTPVLKGEGPVVIVPFATYNVELVAAFKDENGRYLLCNGREGGSYMTADYAAEVAALSNSNGRANGKTRDLIKIAKCWQRECSVPIRSFLLELAAIEFLDRWPRVREENSSYHWMTRDFFEFLVEKSNKFVEVPGTREVLGMGGGWTPQAQTAYAWAKKACAYEAKGTPTQWSLAAAEWRKIFGDNMLEVPS